MSQSDDSARPTAVFVGLGAMGAAMAERIGTSGGAIFSDLVLYNRTPAKAERLRLAFPSRHLATRPCARRSPPRWMRLPLRRSETRVASS